MVFKSVLYMCQNKTFVILLTLLLACTSLQAKSRSEVCPEWFVADMPKNMVVGVSVPCDSKSIARQHAVYNAILHWIITKGKGTSTSQVTTQTKGVDNSVETITTIVDKIEVSGFTYLVKQAYYNPQGECFVQCEMIEDDGLNMNTLVVERESQITHTGGRTEWSTKLLMTSTIDETTGTFSFKNDNQKTTIVINDAEVHNIKSLEYDETELRNNLPSQSILLGALANSFSIGLWQSEIAATAPLCPAILTIKAETAKQQESEQEVTNSAEPTVIASYQGAYVPFPIHYDYVDKIVLGVSVDEAINLSAQVPQDPKWKKIADNQQKRTGLGETWWKLSDGYSLTRISTDNLLPYVLNKQEVFWQAWASYPDRKLPAKTYKVVPIWFMDASVRNFKAEQAERIGQMMCIAFQ